MKEEIKRAIGAWAEWSPDTRRAHYHGYVGDAGYCWVLTDLEGRGGCLWWHPKDVLRGPMAGAVKEFL